MRRYSPLMGTLILLLLGAIAGIMPVQIESVYAQESLQGTPDFSGTNIYFSEANGEPSRFDRTETGISRFAGLLQLSGANLFTLEWRKGIPADADLIVIPGPDTDLSSDMVARLWAYIENGGHVLILADALGNNGSVSRALPANGLFQLTWSDIGLRAQQNVIVREGDVRAVDVVEQDRNGEVTFEFSGELPILETEFLTRRVNPEHPITNELDSLLASSSSDGEDSAAAVNLNSLYFNGARVIEVDASLDLGTLTPLIFTDDATLYGESDFARYLNSSYVEYNVDADSSRGNLILGAAYERESTDTRLVLYSDADMIRNGSGFAVAPVYSGAFVYPTNAQLMLRTVAWLLDRQPTTVDFEAPGPTATPTITPTPLPTATPEAIPTQDA